jgi:hypothetical protein
VLLQKADDSCEIHSTQFEQWAIWAASCSLADLALHGNTNGQS